MLQLLLVLSTSSVSSEETPRSMALVPYTEPQPQPTAFELADVIYEKQKECDAIVSEAVTKALGGDTFEPPAPDGKYLQCKELLDEKKREYIKSHLEGLGYYLRSFPMVRSNRELVKLPAPHDDTLPVDQTMFDIQQELCVTNNVCLGLLGSTEQNRKTRCLAFFNDLKSTYVQIQKFDVSWLKQEGRGLSVVCSERELALALPEGNSGNPKENLSTDEKEFKSSTKSEEDKSSNLFRRQYDNVVKELKTRFERMFKAKVTRNDDLQHSEEEHEVPSAEVENDEHIIRLMERDCEELLEWAEQPSILRSLVKFRQLYDECTEQLNVKRSRVTNNSHI